MGTVTTTFYIIGGTFTTIAALLMFGSYLSTRKTITGYLALAFLFVGLHAYMFALPIVLAPGNIPFLEYGYALGIGFIFLVLLSGLEVMRFMTKERWSESNMNAMGLVLSLLAAIAMIVMISDPRQPIINPSGIIFWNEPPIAQWIIGLTSFIYGAVWGVIFYRAALYLDDMRSRFKMLVISANGFLLGTVALLVHTSSNELQTVLGHTLFIIAGVITLAIYLIPKRFFTMQKRGKESVSV